MKLQLKTVLEMTKFCMIDPAEPGQKVSYLLLLLFFLDLFLRFKASLSLLL